MLGVNRTEGDSHNMNLLLLAVNLLVMYSSTLNSVPQDIVDAQVHVWRLNMLMTDKCTGVYPIYRNHPWLTVALSHMLPDVGTLVGWSILLVHPYLPPSMGNCFWPLWERRYWSRQAFWYFSPFQGVSYVVRGKINSKRWSFILLLSADSFLCFWTPGKTQ